MAQDEHRISKRKPLLAAERRGVDPSRIIFAGKLPMEDHLARYALADIFLDTFNFNAHTTACDALWAGLPIVTKIRKKFCCKGGWKFTYSNRADRTYYKFRTRV